MGLKKYDIDPAALDPDGISDGVSTAVVQILLTGALTAGSDLNGLASGNSSAGATVTLDGDLTGGGVYGDSTGIPRHIYILDTGADVQTGATYTITGTNARGDTLIESIAGPAASGFVLTTNRFKRVTSIAIASPVALSTVDIGVNGHFTSSDGLAHRLDIIGSAHVQTGSTYTITGTDSNGNAQTEDIAGPGSGATIETVKYFLTVSSLVIDTPVASSSIDFGTVDEVISKVIPLNWRADKPATVTITGVAGTIEIHVEEAFDEVITAGIANTTWFAAASLATLTADTAGVSLAQGTTAVRARVESYTAGAEFQFHITQLAYTL